MPPKCTSCDVEQLAHLARHAALLAHLAHQRRRAATRRGRCRRRAASSSPGGSRARRSGSAAPSLVAHDQGVRRDPLHAGTAGGRPAPRAPAATTGTLPSSTSADRLPGGLGGRAVDLDHPRLRRVERHPAVVHDAQRVGVDPAALAPDAAAGGRSRPGRSRRPRRAARSPRAPRAPPRRAGPRRGRGRRRAASTAPRVVTRGREPAEQDAVVAEDHGVRRDPLALRKAAHPSNLAPAPGRAADPTWGRPPRAARGRTAAPRVGPGRGRRGGRGTTARARRSAAGARAAAARSSSIAVSRARRAAGRVDQVVARRHRHRRPEPDVDGPARG